MILKKYSQHYTVLILLMFISIAQFGCKKADSDLNVGDEVIVNFNFNNQTLKHSNNLTSLPKSYYRYDENTALAVSYTSIDDITKLASTSSNVPGWDRTTVGNGVPIRILAFDKTNDTLCSEILYTVGATDNEPMKLQAGKEYKFVAMSLYSETPAVPELATTSDFKISPNLEYSNSNPKIKKLSEAKIRYITAQVGNSIETSIFPAIFPLYFFRKDDFGVLSAENNVININLKQIHSQIKFNFTADPTFEAQMVMNPELKIESDKLYYSGITDSPTYFSMDDGRLLATNMYPFVPDFNKNNDVFFPNTIICHMLEDEDKAKVTIRISYELPNNPVRQVRYLVLDNLPLRNGLRYNVNVRLVPISQVPVGADILRLSEEVGFDREEDVLW